MRGSLLGTFLAAAALLVACSASLADRERDARAALDGRNWILARSLAEEALRSPNTGSDPALEWRLEQIRLEALAGDKQGADIVASLARLATSHPQQATPALYRALADKLKTAGDTGSAVAVLVAGDQRFPAEHEVFAEAIRSLQQRGLNPAETERLKALGYL